MPAPPKPGHEAPPGRRPIAAWAAAGMAMPAALVAHVRRAVAWTAEAIVPDLDGSPFAGGGQPGRTGAGPGDGRPGADAADGSDLQARVTEPALPDPMAAWAEGEGPAIHRILRGNLALLELVVADLAGPDPVGRERWQRQLEALMEAVLEQALDRGLVDLPAIHPFWGAFSRDQGRLLLEALGAIGYHFDGRGGWLDARVPGRRDLTLAMEYARVDPVRLRSWPSAEAMERLLADVVIAGDEYLAEVAPDLALTQLASVLGPRSLQLAELWLNWERVRSMLLAEEPRDRPGADVPTGPVWVSPSGEIGQQGDESGPGAGDPGATERSAAAELGRASRPEGAPHRRSRGAGAPR